MNDGHLADTTLIASNQLLPAGVNIRRTAQTEITGSIRKKRIVHCLALFLFI